MKKNLLIVALFVFCALLLVQNTGASSHTDCVQIYVNGQALYISPACDIYGEATPTVCGSDCVVATETATPQPGATATVCGSDCVIPSDTPGPSATPTICGSDCPVPTATPTTAPGVTPTICGSDCPLPIIATIRVQDR